VVDGFPSCGTWLEIPPTFPVLGAVTSPWCSWVMGQELTPAQRSLRARLAVHASWANTKDRAGRTAAARKVALDRFDRQVDPDNELPPEERAALAQHARRAYFIALALRSAQARAQRRRDRESSD
jgi:hypothetical protein